MRRNPDLFATIAVALYLWAGAALPPVSPDAIISNAPEVQEEILQAVKAEVQSFLSDLVFTFDR